MIKANYIMCSTSKKTLDELYDQQRVIEEENKKRKCFLERAIEERYKHSIQENNTLIQVKQELLKLDNLVTRDISILRAKIEEANRMYTQAK
jgi:RAB6-interacting golgin